MPPPPPPAAEPPKSAKASKVAAGKAASGGVGGGSVAAAPAPSPAAKKSVGGGAIASPVFRALEGFRHLPDAEASLLACAPPPHAALAPLGAWLASAHYVDSAGAAARVLAAADALVAAYVRPEHKVRGERARLGSARLGSRGLIHRSLARLPPSLFISAPLFRPFLGTSTRS